MKACKCIKRMAKSFLNSEPGGGEFQSHVPAALLLGGGKPTFPIDLEAT
jgi:hypothetical protein